MSTATATSSTLYLPPPQCFSTTLPTPSSPDTERPTSKTVSPGPTRSRSLRLKAVPPERVPIPPRLVSSHHLQSPESIFQRSISSHATPSAEDENWLQDTVPIRAFAENSPNHSPIDNTGSARISSPTTFTGAVKAVLSPDSKTAPPSPPLFRERSRRTKDATRVVVPSRPAFSSTRSTSDSVITLGIVGAVPNISPTCYFST